MRAVYKFLNGISRAWNKLVLLPGLKRSFASCGKNVSIGRRFEVSGVENIHVGHDVFTGPSSTMLTTRAHIRIGNYVMAGPNLTIITGDHRTDILNKPMMAVAEDEKLPENDQDVVIGNDVWIGSGVTLLKGVHIADHCVIAAGAVVTKNIPTEYSIYGGVPARELGLRSKG